MEKFRIQLRATLESASTSDTVNALCTPIRDNRLGIGNHNQHNQHNINSSTNSVHSGTSSSVPIYKTSYGLNVLSPMKKGALLNIIDDEKKIIKKNKIDNSFNHNYNHNNFGRNLNHNHNRNHNHHNYDSIENIDVHDNDNDDQDEDEVDEDDINDEDSVPLSEITFGRYLIPIIISIIYFNCFNYYQYYLFVIVFNHSVGTNSLALPGLQIIPHKNHRKQR